MKYASLKCMYIILYYLGIFQLFYFFRRNKQLVVTYHNIISDEIFDNTLIHLGVSCNESTFVKQINRISSKFKITTRVGIPKTCIISFDDGYKNNIEIAARILSEKNIAGLFFIPACYFENNVALWVDRLLMWVSYVSVGDYFILGKNYSIDENTMSRSVLWEHLYQKILLNYSILTSLMIELNNHYPFDKFKKIIGAKMYDLRFEPMQAEEFAKIKNMGHKIGCHSYKHDILSLLSDEQLEYDFSLCATHSEKYNTDYYSYPFGGKNEVSEHVIQKCKKYNYSAAFLNTETDKQDIYSLSRISLGNKTNKYCIEAQLCGFEGALKKIMKGFVCHTKISKRFH